MKGAPLEKNSPSLLRRLAIAVGLLSLAILCCGDREGSAKIETKKPGRIILIGIDGASPRVVNELIASGRLPNLAALERSGVHGTIRSSKPISSPRLWNTIATGKVPEKHGILSFADTTGEAPKLYLSTDRLVHSLWNIASDAGLRTGVVNFWNTYPPEMIDGVMVSDHLLARDIEQRLALTGADQAPGGPVVHPESWHRRLEVLLETQPRPVEFTNPLRDNPELPAWLELVGDDLPRHFDEDATLTAIALEIESEIRPDLMMVLLPGIDRICHFLWGVLEPAEFYPQELRPNDSERVAGREAIYAYYEYTDQLIGRLIAGYGEEDLVVVLSDHGFEAGRGLGILTGIHESEAALDGVFFARGPRIAPGSVSSDSLALEDVTPTLLAWLGLPVGEDMDGRPASFLRGPIPRTIPTHDLAPIARAPLGPSGVEKRIVDQLRRLGYLE